jgi:hypothetical protein
LEVIVVLDEKGVVESPPLAGVQIRDDT